jgi:hypothetical protein
VTLLFADAILVRIPIPRAKYWIMEALAIIFDASADNAADFQA